MELAQAGERTRLVLNLKQATNYKAQLQGKSLVLVLDNPKLPPGIFDLIDQTCALNKTDEILFNEVKKAHEKGSHLLFPKFANVRNFTVKHTARDVEYMTDGFVDKNKDGVDDAYEGKPQLKLWVVNIRATEKANHDDLPALRRFFAKTHDYYTGKVVPELRTLLYDERPKIVEIVSWAAGNGDRSENGDYIYGKKRLREIDRRVRFLVKRLETATVVTPSEQENTEQVFFGATVTVFDVSADAEQTYQIVGVDEANASEGRISWIAPLSRALLKAREGDVVRFASPAGVREIEVVEIRYE